MLDDNRASILRTLFTKDPLDMKSSHRVISLQFLSFIRKCGGYHKIPLISATILWCIAFSDIKFTTYGVCVRNETRQHSTDAGAFWFELSLLIEVSVRGMLF